VRLLIAARVGPVRLIDNSAATDALAAWETAPSAPRTDRTPLTTVPTPVGDHDRQLERIG
jgi:hypothetical protein